MTTDGAPGCWPASPLWDAALAHYAQPGAAAACLDLQDRHGADVLLLLLACWLGRRGAALSDDAARHCRALAADWAGLVRPLRDVRRRLKGRLETVDEAIRAPLAATRERVREAELALERLALVTLGRETARLEPAAEPGAEAAAAALRRLVPLGPAARPEVRALLGAGFPEASHEELERAARRATSDGADLAPPPAA